MGGRLHTCSLILMSVVSKGNIMVEFDQITDSNQAYQVK